MKLNSLTKERAEKLVLECAEMERQKLVLEGTPLEDMWMKDLDELEARYVEDRKWRVQLQNPEGLPVGQGAKSSSAKVGLGKMLKRTK
jgi:hypothetical protein